MKTIFYNLETKGKLLSSMRDGNLDTVHLVMQELDRLENRIRDLELGIDLAYGKKEQVSRPLDIEFDLTPKKSD